MGYLWSNGRRSSRSHSSFSTTAQNSVSPFHRRPRFEPLEDRRLLSIYSVNSLADLVADDGLVTLREALQAANTNAIVYDAPAGSNAETDVITFAPELFTDGVNPTPARITLGGTQLEITDPAGVDIQGPGAKLLTIDANQQSRVLNVDYKAVVSLSRLTITGGFTDYGGGSLNDGGGILCKGTCSIVDAMIVNNVGNYDGGGICNEGTCSIVNTTIANNTAGWGGGFANYGTVTLVNSTLWGNSSICQGGGIYNHGTLSVANSTIVGNTGNTAGPHMYYAGGIYSPYYNSLSLVNSIVAGNSAPQNADIVADLSAGSGYNVIGIWPGLSTPAPNTVYGTLFDPLNPMLMAVLDEDGEFVGLRPLPGSPAIDAGSNALAVDPSGNPLIFDVLGQSRIVGAAVDIGAVELQPEPQLAVSPMTPVDLTEGETAAIQVALTSAPAGPVTVTVEKTPDGSDDVFVNKTTLRFNATNWNVPQTVTLLVAQDADWNDDDAATLLFSASAMDTVLLNVVVDDDDVQHYVVNSPCRRCGRSTA